MAAEADPAGSGQHPLLAAARQPARDGSGNRPGDREWWCIPVTPSGVSCLALDFGGTIATPGPSPHGHDVTEVLRTRFGYRVQPGLAETIEAVRNEAA